MTRSPRSRRAKLVSGISFAGLARWRPSRDGRNAVVLVTEWPEFLELDWQLMAKTMRGHPS